MLNETHYPSKWSVAAVFMIILLMIGGVFSWAFYFNLGTLRVNADQKIQMTVNSELVECDGMYCELDLPPGDYQVQVSSLGFYSESFSVSIDRFKTLQRDLSFVLIPFLTLYDGKLPEAPEQNYQFEKKSNESLLVSKESKETVVVFESLQDPLLSIGSNIASIVDGGRLFFVDLETGRKQRKFNESVVVNYSDTSFSGERSMLFVEMENENFMWIWFHDNDELLTVPWYSNPELFQWQNESDQMAYVISSQIAVREQESFLEDLLDVTEFGKTELGLFSYNFDTEEVQLIKIFGELEVPQELMKRGNRYFLEYEDGSVEELVVTI